jgi:hypothetical protein
VKLASRSEPETASGLRLPVVRVDPNRTEPVVIKNGVYPEKEFDWQLNEIGDGSTALTISVYCFYYDPKSTDARFHRNYEFTVPYAKTDLAISSVELDKASFEPGEHVRAVIGTENQGGQHKVLVSATVIRAFGDEKLAEMPGEPKTLMRGSDSVVLDWTSGSVPAGDHVMEVVLRDSTGSLVDRERAPFSIGTARVELESLRAEPRVFRLGGNVVASLDYRNSGSLPLSGLAVIEVRAGDSLVASFSDAFALLEPRASRHVEDTWSTRSATHGTVYTIMGYVSYAGTSTLPEKVLVSTNVPPTASFSLVPEASRVDEEVSLDATGSQDSDGSIAEYSWEFGDGGSNKGERVTHSYALPGEYRVVLTVRDNEGGIGAAEKTVTVTE